MVTKTINKTLEPREPKPKPAPSPIRITLPYVGPISHQISRLIKNKAAIDVTFSSGKTIKTLLRANGRGTSTQNPNPRGCIYQIPCNCGQQYIGETLRPINTRVKEHQTSVTKLDQKSAISEHIINHQAQTIQWEAIKILSTNNNNWRQRKLQEAIDIKRQRPTINRDQGIFLPSAWDLLI